MKKANERSYSIIIPMTKQKIVEDVADAMTKHFGGVTIFPSVRGYWRRKGQSVYDENIMLFSARDLKKGQSPVAIFQNDWRFMRELAKEIARKTGQESIYIEQDIIRDVEFVSRKKLKRME